PEQHYWPIRCSRRHPSVVGFCHSLLRTWSTAALVLLFALPAFSQGKLVETIEVRLANVDVVVRDRHGNPVVGLTKADFEIFENGVPQPVTNFYEVRRDAPAKLPDTAAAAPSDVVPTELR